MSEREHYPPGVPCWVDTLQPDPEAATRFYAELFGWEFVGPGPMPGEPPGRYFVARLRGKEVAGVGSTPPHGPPSAWNTYVAVAGADEAAERATKAGGAVIVAPFDTPPVGRLAVLGDPAGAVFCIWESSTTPMLPRTRRRTSAARWSWLPTTPRGSGAPSWPTRRALSSR